MSTDGASTTFTERHVVLVGILTLLAVITAVTVMGLSVGAAGMYVLDQLQTTSAGTEPTR